MSNKLILIENVEYFLNYDEVALFGIVLETGIPKRSRGTDYVCSVRIIDQSILKITVNVFTENMGSLPYVKLAGDIIGFSFVKIKKLNGEKIYAHFDKRTSGFALFDGKNGTNNDPYQVSGKFQAKNEHKKLIADLRKWSSSNQIDGGINPIISLKEIKAEAWLNVMCKVLHVSAVSNDTATAYIWDGTDTPTTFLDNKLQDEMENPLNLDLDPVTLSRDVLITFPTVGTILRLNIDQGTEKFNLDFLRAIKWVVFKNIYIVLKSEVGLWQAQIATSTKVRLLSDDDPLAIQLQKNHDVRFYSEWGSMPSACFPYHSQVTVTCHQDVPYVTLMDILTHTEVTAIFRCIVRIVSILPGKAEQFRDREGTIMIRLTLDDPTARIHAFLYAEDGDMFFGENRSIEVMEKKKNRLLGVVTNKDGAPRSPPWIDTCIKSYYIDENDKWGSRKFRIFDTKAVLY